MLAGRPWSRRGRGDAWRGGAPDARRPMRPGRGAQLGKNVIAAVSEIAFGPHAMPPTALW